MDIVTLLPCLAPVLPPTPRRHLGRIALALLTMPGRVTMRGLARWTERGGSYRTLQRWFATPLPWAQLFWLFFRPPLWQPDDVYILAGDEVVMRKAGKQTHGVDRFFSGVEQQVVPGLGFFSLALISTTARRAFPLRLDQTVRTPQAKARRPAKAPAAPPHPPAAKCPPGRPKGSRNRPKTAVSWSPELLRIQTILQAQMQLFNGLLPVVERALDGHFGNSPTLQMVQGCGVPLISKLRADAALYGPYSGAYAGRGPHRKYGERLDLGHLPPVALRTTQVADGVETRIYQARLLHKEFAQPLNVVILIKRHLRTGRPGHALLFSSALDVGYEQVIDYYRLRFQIEFTFRDAKQYWGLDDFMTTTAVGVTNAANLALFMVNLSRVLLEGEQERDPACSVLDLKARYRAAKYVRETLKMLAEKPDEDLIRRVVRQVARLGRIHPATAYPDAA